MLSQIKKKIYIIHFNPEDFFDLTLEALENLRKSDLRWKGTIKFRAFMKIMHYVGAFLSIKKGLIQVISEE